MGSLYLLGYPVTVAVLRDAVKGTLCIISSVRWKTEPVHVSAFRYFLFSCEHIQLVA